MGRIGLVLLLGLTLAGCSESVEIQTESGTVATPSTTSPPTSTTANSTPTSTAVKDDTEFLRSQLLRLGEPESGAILLAVLDADGRSSHVTAGTNSIGETLGLDDPFRIGSVTKMFTATLVLMLLDDGLIGLDDHVRDYLPSLTASPDATVRHLLSHRSGISDYTDYAIFGDQEEGLSKAWTPEELYGIAAGRPQHFPPGERFEYSNTNYLMLGMLVESVTGMSYAEALRQRVLQPLSLSNTYQAPHEQGESPTEAFSGLRQQPGSVALADFDYTSIETAAWASGDLVSTVTDLDKFLRGLAQGALIPDGLFREMRPGDDSYGLGIENLVGADDVIGHRGGIPGYNTVVIHNTTTSRTAIVFTTNDTVGFATVTKPIAERLASDTP